MNIGDLFAFLKIKPDQKSFDAADKAIGMVRTALAGLAAYATGNFFKGLVQDTIALGGKLSDLAAKTGVPAEALQELGYAASQNGSSLEGMTGILGRLSRNIASVGNGNKELSKTFRKAGISVKEADGSMRPAADVLGDIADHIATLNDEDKPARAMELLGKSGADLIPMLNGGSEGLAKMRQEARDLGGVISKDAVGALDDLGDEQDRVKFAMQGIRNEAVIALLPTLKDMATGVLTWVKANRKWLAQRIESVVRMLAKGLVVAGKVIAKVADLFKFLADNSELVIIAIMSMITAIALFKIQAIQAAIATAISWGAAALPFVLIAALIAALILIIEDLWVAFKGGDSLIGELLGKEAIEKLRNGFRTIGEIFMGVLATVKSAVQWLVDKITWLGDKAVKIKRAILGEASTGDEARKIAEVQATAMRLTGKNREAFISKAVGAFASRDAGTERPDDLIGPVVSGDTALAGPRPVVAGASAPINSTVQINVSSPNADPKAVAAEITRTTTEAINTMLRNASRGVGVR